MPRRADWRSATTVETLDRLDRAGFAWEFLRRNPRYRKEYSQIRKDAARATPVAEALGQRWGLFFACDPKLASAALRSSGDRSLCPTA